MSAPSNAHVQLPSLADVEEARRRIAGSMHVTPLVHSTMLGKRIGAALHFKCENFQKTGSFKSRGALNAVSQLNAAERRAGVVSVSAGNHAQGLAWAADAVGAPCIVVMPAGASKTKVAASEGYGATVRFEPTSPEAFARARQIATDDGMIFVHPFDHPHIACGAGTVGLEILEQLADVDIVVIPVGGGGLLGGVALAIKERAPRVRIYGVEPVGAAAMRGSLDAGRPIHLERMQTIADGLAAPMAGELTYAFAKRYVDDVVVVPDDTIAEAVRLTLSYTKMLAEPAGAAALAALVADLIPHRPTDRIVAILSGGNVDLPRLAQLL